MARPVNEVAEDSLGCLLAYWVHSKYGLISLLEDLQRRHPEFEEESVFRALEELRENDEEADPIIEELKELFPSKAPDKDDPIWKDPTK